MPEGDLELPPGCQLLVSGEVVFSAVGVEEFVDCHLVAGLLLRLYVLY